MVSTWEEWVKQVAKLLGVDSSAAFTLLFVLISLLVPVALFVGAVLAVRSFSGDRTVPARRLFVLFAYMFVPVGLAMHLTHNVAHLVNEGSGLFAVLSDPFGYGWDLFGAANSRTLPLSPVSALSLSQIALLVMGQAIATYVGYKLARVQFGEGKIAERTVTPLLVLAIVFTMVNIWVLGLPMAHRD